MAHHRTIASWTGRSLVAALMLLPGCGAPASRISAYTPPEPEPGHFRSQAGEGEVQITWSIPEEQQPPLLDGAREVLTSAAISRFGGVIGGYLDGSQVVYDGVVTIGAVDPTEVMASWNTQASSDQGMHDLTVYAGRSQRWVAIRQDRQWGALEADARPPSGLGSAWVDGATQAGERLYGRCRACMTILEDDPADAIALSTSSLDPEDAAPVDVHVAADLIRVRPDAFTPEVLSGLWSTMGDEATAGDVLEFVEVVPFVWERTHTDRTYLRCKEGGSRLVDYRTTWRLRPGDPARSGVGDIEVFDAAPCESFDYGGGS